MILTLVKQATKRVVGRVDIRSLEGLLVYPVIKRVFTELETCKLLHTREELWSEALARSGGEAQRITYVEFGVYQGWSIGFFSERNKSENSLFVGLDSFEGLPEKWGTLEAGHFSTGGNAPQVSDPRVSFIKGWFQDTDGVLHGKLVERENLIVHYDADLYSSTLFALTRMDTFKKRYLAIFDEFTGDESRALYNYSQSHLASVRFLSKTVGKFNYPVQVLCEITPRGAAA